MIAKKLILGTAVAALMAGGAFAQDAAPMSPDATTPPAVNQEKPMDGAQTPDTTGSTNATDDAASASGAATGPITFVTTLDEGQIEVSELTGKQVLNAQGEELGDISDIVVDREGEPTIVVIGVGGFLGLGEKSVGVPFERLEMVRGEDDEIALRLNTNRDELTNAPDYEGDNRQAAAPGMVEPSVTEPAVDAPAATDTPVEPAPAAPNAQ